MSSSRDPIPNPQLLVKEIADIYTRQNFQALAEYFRLNNQLLDFSFFEVNLEAGVPVKVAHGLGVLPLDILPTQIVRTDDVPNSEVVVTVDFDASDSIYLALSATQKCRFRFFVGNYSKFQSNLPLTGFQRFTNGF